MFSAIQFIEDFGNKNFLVVISTSGKVIGLFNLPIQFIIGLSGPIDPAVLSANAKELVVLQAMLPISDSKKIVLQNPTVSDNYARLKAHLIDSRGMLFCVEIGRRSLSAADWTFTNAQTAVSRMDQVPIDAISDMTALTDSLVVLASASGRVIAFDTDKEVVLAACAADISGNEPLSISVVQPLGVALRKSSTSSSSWIVGISAGSVQPTAQYVYVHKRGSDHSGTDSILRGCCVCSLSFPGPLDEGTAEEYAVHAVGAGNQSRISPYLVLRKRVGEELVFSRCSDFVKSRIEAFDGGVASGPASEGGARGIYELIGRTLRQSKLMEAHLGAAESKISMKEVTQFISGLADCDPAALISLIRVCVCSVPSAGDGEFAELMAATREVQYFHETQIKQI